jgi:hypothetical protein
VTRRIVRVTDDLFEDLDRYLGPERGPNGEPSAMDFLRLDLMAIVDVIAERFDQLPEAIPGHPEYRILITAGRLVPRVAVMGMLSPDGAIELIQLDLDLDSDWT